MVNRACEPEPASRLAACIGARGGITPEEAMRRAANNMAFIRTPWLAQLGALLDRLQAQGRERADAPLGDELQELKHLALEAGDVAAAFGHPYTAQALESLYELLLIYEETGVWDERAYALHLSSIGLLRDATPGRSHAGGQSALELLRTVGPVQIDEVAIVAGLDRVIDYLCKRAGLSERIRPEA